MTAAERQRKCRAGGKGRHRGGTTREQKAEARRLVTEMFAAAQAAHAAQQAAQAAAQAEAQPAAQPATSPIAA